MKPETFWTAFGCCLVVIVITTIIMVRQARHFHYQEGTIVRKFSIMDLEWPADRQAMITLLRKVRQLPESQRKETISALRGQLVVDFFYMPATYGAVFLLCMAAAFRYTGRVHSAFILAGWIQAACWLCDILENCYCLYKINVPEVSSVWVFAGYRLIEIVKWGGAVGAFLSAVVALIVSLFK